MTTIRALRTIPFGYQMVDGKTALNPTESPMVLEIYSKYIGGYSYNSLAEYLSQGFVPYHNDTYVWNKNMVKRILEDSRYLGNDIYPLLISLELFQQVEEVRVSRRTVQKKRKKPTEIITDIPVKNKKLRVAAYCRVSSNSPEQVSSYFAQMEYYKSKIHSNSDWIPRKVYGDKGCSGLTIEKRPELQKLLKRCWAGQVDYILVKSVERLTRNVLDCLWIVRKLKEKGIGIYFETETLDTLTLNDELLLTLYAIFAQLESEVQSRGQKMGIREKFKQGEFTFPSALFGYCVKDSKVDIHPIQGGVVKEIYRLFLKGHRLVEIAKILKKSGLKTRNGTSNWNEKTVHRILQNEKYTGNALLQKTYKDSMFERSKRNTGQLPQYYVEDSHPAIISLEDFNKVEELLASGLYSTKLALSSLLRCSTCGENFKRTVRANVAGVKTYYWSCKNRTNKNEERCYLKAPFWKETVLRETIDKELRKALPDTAPPYDDKTYRRYGWRIH